MGQHIIIIIFFLAPGGGVLLFPKIYRYSTYKNTADTLNYEICGPLEVKMKFRLKI